MIAEMTSYYNELQDHDGPPSRTMMNGISRTSIDRKSGSKYESDAELMSGPMEDDRSPPRRRSKLSELYHMACWNVRSHYKILIAGQVLSFSLSVTGAAQATLYFDCNLSAPTFTVGLFYCGLIFCLIPVYRQGHQQIAGKHQAITQLDYEEESSEGEFVGQANNKVTAAVHGRGSDFRRSLEQEPESLALGVSHSPAIPPPQHTFLGVIPLHNAAWKYIPVALLDVYANYFTVLAFSYTTITSVTLFDALAIPTAMVVSAVFLSRKYTRLHLLGVGACSIGILLNVLQDYVHDKNDNNSLGSGDVTVVADDVVPSNGSSTTGPYYPNKLRGDLFALMGGVLFGINNTVGEVAVRSLGGPNEYLGMLGVFATCICIVQSVLTERDEIAEFFNRSGDRSATCSEATAWWVLVGYFVSAIVCYLGASRFLQVSEAAFYNLSLLTGDLWSVAFSVVAQRIVPQPLFFVALVFILSGVVLYEMAPSPVDEEHHGIDGSARARRVRIGNPGKEDAPSTWRRHANPQGNDLEHEEFELSIMT